MTPQDIQQLAREAGFEVHDRKHEVRVGIDALIGLDSTPKLRHFAALVLERAAKVCDVTPPDPFRPSIEAAHALRNMAKGLG